MNYNKEPAVLENAADHTFSFDKSDYNSEPTNSESEHASHREDNPVTSCRSSNTAQVEEYDNAGSLLCNIRRNWRYKRGLLAEPWCSLLTLVDFKLAIWKSLPPYPRSFLPNKAYREVTQWQGKEVRNLGRCILGVFASSLQSPTPTQQSLLLMQYNLSGPWWILL